MASSSYVYDKNRNMTNDHRRALNIGYYLLNLLTGRKATSGGLKASYLLVNGIKGA